MPTTRLHVRRNDTVLVLSGKDRGKKGKVLRIFPSGRRAIVESINFVSRHTRQQARGNVSGGIVRKEAALHVSKLQVICPECDKPTRVGRKVFEGAKHSRVCRKCSGLLDK